jgi:PAS domain-containing protein
LKPSFRHLVSMMHPDDRAANAEIEALALKGLPLDRRFRIILSDGRLRWLEQRGEVLFDREGRPSKAVGIFLDVTTRQETLHAVRTRAERYLALRAAVSEIVILTHADGSVIDLLEWCKVTGQSITTVSHAFWLDAVHVEDRAVAQKSWNDAKQVGAPFRTEVRVMFGSDGVRWMILKGAPVTDDHGVVQEWIVTLADANEMKVAQNQAEGPQLLSGAQIRAARAILNWSVRDLAEKAAVPVSTIRRLEEFDGVLDTPLAKAAAIRTTLEQAGCEFVFPRTGKPGVRPR